MQATMEEEEQGALHTLQSPMSLMVPATADSGINPYYVHNINTQLSAPTSIKYESRTSQKYCFSEAKHLFMLLSNHSRTFILNHGR